MLQLGHGSFETYEWNISGAFFLEKCKVHVFNEFFDEKNYAWWIAIITDNYWI